ncbi:hypothetical protein MRB53_041805 [Persea americana]|nr:hypothetical protein MRB53_041805 [Persea americana]
MAVSSAKQAGIRALEACLPPRPDSSLSSSAGEGQMESPIIVHSELADLIPRMIRSRTAKQALVMTARTNQSCSSVLCSHEIQVVKGKRMRPCAVLFASASTRAISVGLRLRAERVLSVPLLSICFYTNSMSSYNTLAVAALAGPACMLGGRHGGALHSAVAMLDGRPRSISRQDKSLTPDDVYIGEMLSRCRKRAVVCAWRGTTPKAEDREILRRVFFRDTPTRIGAVLDRPGERIHAADTAGKRARSEGVFV